MAPPRPPLLPLISPQPGERRKDRRGARSTDTLQGLYERIKGGLPERRTFRERRATPRVTVDLEVEQRQGESRYVRLTNDLSTFGLSVREGPTPKVGAKMVLALFLPDDPMSALELEAEVLGSYDAKGGMRVKFQKPSIEVVRRIHKYLLGVKKAP